MRNTFLFLCTLLLLCGCTHWEVEDTLNIATETRADTSNMIIQGETIIAMPPLPNTATEEYRISNLPAGAIVEWSSPTLKILSGQGTGTVLFEISSMGTHRIYAIIYFSTGDIASLFLDVCSDRAPIITDIRMDKYLQGNGEFILKAITNQPEGTFTWSVEGSHAVLSDIRFHDDASFLDEPNTYKSITFYETGIYTITVKGTIENVLEEYVYSKTVYINEKRDTYP